MLVKDFSDTNNPPYGYTSTDVTNIKNIFDKLKGSSKRGYEVCSNPGSIFRNVTKDELILNFYTEKDYNTTWQYDGNDWVNTTTQTGTAISLFTGSHIAFNHITNKLFYSDGTNVTYIANISEGGSGSISWGDNIYVDSDGTVSALPMIYIKYQDLVNLKNANNLIPGEQYRITDFVTTVANDNQARSAEHSFDILVTADSNSTLNENAKAIQHEGDTYFSNSKLSSWEIKYSLENDNTRFAWADTTNGKGIIYYMKDEWNNECPYDFKNIQFKRYAVSDVINTNLDTDALNTFIYNEGSQDIMFAYQNNNISINGSILVVDSTTSQFYYTFTWIDENG
jgi:hypothetical protein